MGVILTELNKDDDLEDRTMLTSTEVVRLVEICLRSTSFQYNNIYYEQIEGTAMGSPLSPVIANLYMEFFEKLAIEKTPLKPKMWKRYVDDTFVVWEHGLESELTSFLEHLNSLRPSIQFTCEVEEGGKLPFLDVQLVRNGSSLETSVYRKKTHTDRYLHYNSHHHPRVKVGIVKTLKDRASRICQSSKLRGEISRLQEVFEDNVYPTAVVKKVLQRRKLARPTDTEDKQEMKTLCLPYVQGLSERIERACKKLDVRAVFKSSKTLRGHLCRVKGKQPLDRTKGVIYNIPCTCGREYIGETGRNLRVRIGEHKYAIQRGNMSNAIAVHVHETEHPIDWDSARVTEREKHFACRKIKESLHIKRSVNCINTDPGYYMHPVWFTTLHSMPR